MKYQFVNNVFAVSEKEEIREIALKSVLKIYKRGSEYSAKV